MQEYLYKIQQCHLERQAIIYVRQSSPGQLVHNTGSTMSQYDLEHRARALGWPPSRILIIDEDQAKSAATAGTRSGWAQLIALLVDDQVGAIFVLEASRLARNNSEGHRVIELCMEMQALIIAPSGIYDPRDENDWFVLGFKAQMATLELRTILSRFRTGKMALARKGSYRLRLPTGLIHDAHGAVQLHPDPAVQEALRDFFQAYDQLPSASAIVVHFNQQKRLFPTQMWQGPHKGQLVWSPLTHSRTLSILKNPAYAGVYRFNAGWSNEVILIHDHHPGYITWAQFERNQARLAENNMRDNGAHPGAARAGAALLQGIVLCGSCGRRMSVSYQRSGNHAYACTHAHHTYGEKRCQSMVGIDIDARVVALFLAAVQPAGIAAAAAAGVELEAGYLAEAKRRERELERVRAEAKQTEWRFLQADGAHARVRGRLEAQLDEQLALVEQLTADYAAFEKRRVSPVTAAEAAQLQTLAGDLPMLWHGPTVTHEQRKQLLRCLIRDVTLRRGAEAIEIGICWQTGATTATTVPFRPSAAVLNQTDPAILARIRELAVDHTDTRITQILNQEGYKPLTAPQFERRLVVHLRKSHGIPSGCPSKVKDGSAGPRGDGRYSAKVVAARLNCSVVTVQDWCRKGILDGIQDMPHAPWWIRITPEEIEQLRKP